MLAPNDAYRTAKQLHISEKERSALMQVMNMLRSGEIKPATPSNDGHPRLLDMEIWLGRVLINRPDVSAFGQTGHRGGHRLTVVSRTLPD